MATTKLHMSVKLGLCHLRCPEMKVVVMDYLSKTDAPYFKEPTQVTDRA